jgi:hypothetical protein
VARGATLIKLLNDLRAECRLSLNPANNPQDRDRQVIALQRAQELFWSDFAWPHLRVERFIELQAGQRYYGMPVDLDIDRITAASVRYGTVYTPLCWGIDDAHYAAYDSDLDVRADPAQRLMITEDGQDQMLEVWPIPNTDFDPVSLDNRIKLVGIRKLNPLVADGDRADLDDRLIVLYAAAEYLASIGAKDAQVRQDKANKLYLKLRGSLMPRRKFRLFGGDDYATKPRIVNFTYRAPGSS